MEPDNNGQQPPQQQPVPAINQPTHSERFTNAIEKEFASNGGEIQLTKFQRKLIQNYFIKIDMILKENEVKRLSTSEQYRDPLAFEWGNINMPKLAIDVITFSAVGLDPTQANHLNPIPYKNNKTNKFDITFIIGYKGTEIKSRKYGMNIPDEVVVELVYKTDTFVPFKKNKDNKIEVYDFTINSPFDRGELVGGFYYHNYFDKPERNTLEIFTKADIDKRKPKGAAAEFWGGEKDEWVNGKRTGNKVNVEGWYDEMAYKTIYKAAWNCITIDSEKIDQNYLQVIQRENETKDESVMREIHQNANKIEVGFTHAEVVTDTKPPVEQSEPVKENQQNQPTTDGPGF